MKTATVYTETVVHAAPEQFVADAPYQLAILVGADGTPLQIDLEGLGRDVDGTAPAEAGPERVALELGLALGELTSAPLATDALAARAEALQQAQRAGLDRFDAQLIVCTALGVSRSWVLAHDRDRIIRVAGVELMSSRQHRSEDRLGEIAVDAIKNKMAAEGLGEVGFGPDDYET